MMIRLFVVWVWDKGSTRKKPMMRGDNEGFDDDLISNVTTMVKFHQRKEIEGS